MTIPTNLTAEEVGALLVLVGEHMLEHNVCADAVLDLSGYANPQLVGMAQVGRMQDLLHEHSQHRIEEIFELTLEEAIAFNPAERT